MSELSTKDLHVLSHNYYNVPGIKAVDKNGNTHTYTNLNREVLGVESNGIYTPPAGTAYETVAINVQDTTGYFDLTTWDGLGRLAASGYAPYMLEVGGIINGTYTRTDGTVYDYPWIIVDFQDVELENGTVRKNVPILQAQYTGHESVVFDAAETTVATETTAQDGYYYVGRSSSTYTLLSLNTGDTIPYSEYATAVYKTPWNTNGYVQFGENCWARSNLRQYLNSSGTGWWIAQHSCDVAPSASQTGFVTYMPSDMLSVVKSIKKTTTRANYMGGTIDITYDKFWIASHSEMNITGSYVADDSEAWEYYKQILESDTPVASGTYGALSHYSCANTLSQQTYWSRSVSKVTAYEFIIGASGSTGSAGTAYTGYAVLPCCALTGA